MSLIRKHVAVLQAWACLALVVFELGPRTGRTGQTERQTDKTRNVAYITAA